MKLFLKSAQIIFYTISILLNVVLIVFFFMDFDARLRGFRSLNIGESLSMLFFIFLLTVINCIYYKNLGKIKQHKKSNAL